MLSFAGGPGCPGSPREVGLVTLRWVKSGREQTFCYFFLSLFCSPTVVVKSLIHFFFLFYFPFLVLLFRTIKVLSSMIDKGVLS